MFKQLCLLVILAVAAWWQTGAGIVRGTVTDASGVIVSNAKVTLTHEETNIKRESASSSVGIYYFGELPPGSYKIDVENAGFRRWSGTLRVEVGQTAVVDLTLEVGSVEAAVEVTDVAPVITTEGMQVADVKDELRIHQLPLNGRSVSNLFNLTPGVAGGGAPRVNGLTSACTAMLMDGISIVNRFCGGVNTLQRRRPALQSSS